MKTILQTLVFVLCISLTGYAQNAQQDFINYQGVASDSSGDPMTNATIAIQIALKFGSSTATASYIETHSVTTDASGVFSLQIGDGSAISGTYNTLNWGVDASYLTISLNGTEVGTTEMVAAPYALYAKKADESQTLTNVITFGNSANGQIKDVVDPTNNQDAATKIYVDNQIDLKIAAFDARLTDIETNLADLDTRLSALEPVTIGQYREGGIVIWIDGTGEHGLVCAVEDQSAGIQWYNGSNITTGATDYTDGSSNTDAIIAAQGPVETDYAAGLARAYSGGGYNDWFLPSPAQLEFMDNNKAIINSKSLLHNGTELSAIYYYWSSRETASDTGIIWSFSDGNGYNSFKSSTYGVRAIRAF
ncbi:MULTISPECIES: DUF1566 domain-containing protein [Bizionia]|uniref:DUF1566 domain-containing protein n=1 Tax=Bizionia algoritergicola TaxID=291187 RepID=A0A5D0R4A7_9FLAO|nr:MULTISPECIES: DUF1566 domain-containing protein [Bizionia]OBX23683.1 hypothetical protein BAA08_03240 [Bizionia sp. APA-3]TYB75404.1 DUF1566 domain-containing protein [Bizionia algoritergicola]